METIKNTVMDAMSNKIADMATKGASEQELEMAINQSKKVIDTLREDEAD